MRHDFWFALRRIRLRPLHSAVIALTLGLGIGAALAVFAVVDAVLVRPLPYPNADRLVVIGNFGDGLIHVYDLDVTDPENATATAEGPLRTSNGDMMAIDGLWALEFGVDAGGFSSDTLYYTAGPDDESHGVFGSIEPDRADDVGAGASPGTAGYSEAGY